jgi:diguanylate cyclase (GGDEF)-like protein/PAS domain S-box-containing protein
MSPGDARMIALEQDSMDADLFTSADAPPKLHRWRRWLASLKPLCQVQTLKVRLAIGSFIALSLGMSVTAWDMSEVAEAAILRQSQQREHIEAQQLASLLSHRVAEIQRALNLAGAELTPAMLADHDQLLARLQGQPILRAMFASVYVTGIDGSVKVLLTAKGESHAVPSVANRDYFQRTLSTNLPVISEPIEGRVNPEPVIVFTEPLRDSGGTWGMLGGSLRLASRDLIGFLTESRDFDDRSAIVITDDAGRILAHPQQASLLKPLALDPRLSEAASKWQQAGRPLLGTAEAWSGAGDVVAMAGEPITGWHVWRVASRDELLAPLHAARANAVKVASIVGAALVTTLGFFLAWQLQPLRKLELRAAELLHGDDVGEWPKATGEIGKLTQTLRHVWAERAQVERFNGQVLQKLSSVMSASPVGLAFVRHGHFELFSAEGCRMLGREESELVGQEASLIFPARDDHITLHEQARSAFDQGQAYEGEWRLLDAAGATFWARIRARPVVAGDPAAGSIWSLNNIEEQVASRLQLERAALNDPLTGVLNRKGFALKLSEIFFAPAHAPSASVVMLDLDHFKPVNDLGGHAAGDAMLQAIARVIASNVRGTDVVARLGGDEFAILLPGCDQVQAMAVAEKVRQSVCELVLPWEDRTFQVGASIGVACRPRLYAGVEQWLAAADAACYEAKRGGRNLVRTAAEPLQPQPIDSVRMH